MQPYNPKLKLFSRHLRTNTTDAEKKLWFHLRRKQILGVQFYRQKPIANYIADFYCATANLVIELDGAQHFENTHQLKDETRDQTLQALGLRVLRFDNRQVLLEIDSVIEVIYREVNERIQK